MVIERNEPVGPGSGGTARLTARGVWRGAVEITPLALFVIPFGIVFGAAASAKAIAPGISVFMSAALFAGASQFAVLDLWQAPLPLATIALAVLAVNARHILLGAALSPWLLRLPFGRRLAAVVFMSDPNFAQALAARARGETDAGILLGSGGFMWIIWIVSTAIGAYAGAAFGDLSRFGLDTVMVAYFAAVVVSQWKGTADLWPWIAAAAVALVAARLLPAGWHIVLGALAGGSVGAFRHGR